MGTQRLQTFKNQMEGSNDDPLSSIAQHVNWQEWHSQQKDKKKDEEQVFEANKNVCSVLWNSTSATLTEPLGQSSPQSIQETDSSTSVFLEMDGTDGKRQRRCF